MDHAIGKLYVVISLYDADLKTLASIAKDESKLNEFVLSGLKKVGGKTADEIIPLANSEEYSDSREFANSVSAFKNETKTISGWKTLKTFRG